MTLPLVAVLVLVLGIIFHIIGTGGKVRGSGTLAEVGRSMIWIGMFFVVAALIGHGVVKLR